MGWGGSQLSTLLDIIYSVLMLNNEKIIMASSHKQCKCPELEWWRGYFSSQMLMINNTIQNITVYEMLLKQRHQDCTLNILRLNRIKVACRSLIPFFFHLYCDSVFNYIIACYFCLTWFLLHSVHSADSVHWVGNYSIFTVVLIVQWVAPSIVCCAPV